MLQIIGLTELQAKLQELAATANDKRTQQRALKTAAKPIRDTASRLAPRRTGRLASSIVITETSSGVAVGTDVPYAGPVEFGTVHQSAQPFIRPALDSEGDRAIDEVGREMWQSITK
jgi:HK97 gp10 family phage protein